VPSQANPESLGCNCYVSEKRFRQWQYGDRSYSLVPHGSVFDVPVLAGRSSDLGSLGFDRMILALVSLCVQAFLVIYLSYAVMEALTFSTGDCAVRSLKWYNFWDRIPGVDPLFVQAKMNEAQYDHRGNRYDYHLFLKLDLFGIILVPFEPACALPLDPTWNLFGSEDDPDHLEQPEVISKEKVLLELTETQIDRL